MWSMTQKHSAISILWPPLMKHQMMMHALSTFTFKTWIIVGLQGCSRVSFTLSVVHVPESHLLSKKILAVSIPEQLLSFLNLCKASGHGFGYLLQFDISPAERYC